MNPRTTQLDRRRFLQVGAAGGAAIVLSTAVGAQPALATRRPDLRVYVLVVDGANPAEVEPLLMPQLSRLRREGTWFANARSLPVMETIPYHVMMMTGVRPDRSGVPANSVFDRREGVVRDLDRPSDLRFPTVIERLNARGATTGTVLSKEYLFGIFGGRATHRWEPKPVLPVTGHAPDAFTVDAAIAMVDRFDPNLLFVNLGDVDRVGHSDLTGPVLQAARTAALVSSDLQVGRFVEHLRRTGRWNRSVVIALADHSMDWSLVTNVVSVAQILSGRPDLRDHLQIAQNGGADLLYWTGRANRRTAALDEIRRLVRAHPGVLSVQRPDQLRLGAEAGDLVCFARAGWRFSDTTALSNPIPGNHGHPVTEPIPFLVSGGHPAVRRGVVRSEPARTLDVAPTVGALFGLGAPRGGYDGTARTSAFTRLPVSR
ncbi:Tat (twin-arginine translocation) pathway signal sequence [Blastococcus aurantiacus]|uniref:Tat (Twin-arginine translocation) pathway signal sequence n=1 Tax=Blastococcus aurantiacus TaxID=1550231 RepID=A0A1G7MWM0_9ACTN|nr:alkaline phosphatase family protein [Blastococcus aurantiacus]SDF66077.1 Tat (twin-arginine translocation) pathway signal sequence [Blastococcus aurantiacus]